MTPMRIALVSPYSWTYPGGVTRHIEALAERFIDDGHEVRVLAPVDPPDRFAALLHRGARPHPALRPVPYAASHTHEPIVPLAGWVATDWTRLPLVGTFHSYSESRVSNGLANLIGARRVLHCL